LMSSSNSGVDSVGPASSPPREPAIDVVFKLGVVDYRTRQQLPLGGPPSTFSSNSVVDAARPASSALEGGRHQRRLPTRWLTLLDPSAAPQKEPAIDDIFNIDGGRYRTCRQRPSGGAPSMLSTNSVVDAARPTGSTPRWPVVDVIFKLGGGRYRTRWQRPPGGPPSSLSSNSLVDAAGPAGSAPRWPAIDVLFKLDGGRCWTRQ
jgi:hypothetical protein